MKGKIFHDIIETIIYRAYRKSIAPAHMTMSGLNVCLDSWECFRKSNALLELKTPNLQVREALEKLGYAIPGHIEIEDLRREIIEGVPMSCIPVTQRTKRNTVKTVCLSPDEKLAAQEKEKNDRLRKQAEDRKSKAEARAEEKFLKAEKKAKESLNPNSL